VIRPLAPSDVDTVGSALGLARLYQGNGFYLVAWDDELPVGHLHLALGDPPEIQDLEVLESARGRGVAKDLIAHAEAFCAMQRHGELRVTVSETNDVARGLYERLGYLDTGLAPRRVTGTVQLRTGPIEVDDTLLTLSKRLDPGR
jgi:ribosomal protein S18 acetylase RimI-like enzyme